MKLLVFALYAIAISAVMARRGVWSATASSIKSSGRRIARILIVGATGGTGRELVRQALERGYEVTAFVRDPAKLAMTHPQLKIVQGDVLDFASVQRAVQGQDAVVSALGHRRFYSLSRTQTKGTRNLVQAMETADVRRFICETSLGLGNSVGRMGILGNFFVLPVILPLYFWDKAGQEQVVAASDLEWVIVRPSRLTSGPKRGTYRHGFDVGGYIGMSRISRADVADFMLNQLREEKYLGTAPGVTW